ncbi:Protein angel-like protein 2 [Larimichthys crocea]|uniref:Protein angel-like protein 2 n=1 Tax=Larimichthys crocea TaxID=215358 RepID=A0A6G0I5L3_LARCR|nr:Protein angel-like protein 2 [Larimichthys crocea]
MFFRQVSSSFLPRGRPALCRAGFRSRSSTSSSSLSHLPHVPAPHPWWSVRGFPPWPPGLPHSRPAARRVFPGRASNPRSINAGGGRCSFSTSAGLMMEQPGRDRGPPYKRRKSTEEKRSAEEREGRRGGGAEGATGGSKREQHHSSSSRDGCHRPSHHHKDGSRGGGSRETGNCVRKDSRDKDGERTRTDKDRQRRDSAGPDQERGVHQHGGPPRSRTQTPGSNPEQDKVPWHKPNPWFNKREEQAERRRDAKAAEGQFRDRSSDEGQQTGLPSQPWTSTHPPNPWQVAGADSQPPPPGTFLPVKPVKALQRHWESPRVCGADVRPPGHGTPFDFSVMSYNILSQELLQDNAYLYRHCEPGVLDWKHRLPSLLSEIRQHSADILCLQEVQQDHYEDQIKPALQALGYQCEYKKRTGKKPDGCAVVFKSSRLSLLSSNPVEYFRPGDALLDRDNVGLVVLLRPNDAAGRSDPSAFICVANTHLLYNPRRGDIKLAQLAILFAEVNRLSRLPDGSANPVVLCGDFNSTPWSPLYRFLTTGCLDYRGLQIGAVSGQENRGQRLLTAPIWPHSLGIDQRCQYTDKPTESSPSSPTAVEGAISNLTMEDLATKAAFAVSRWRIEHSLKLHSSYQHHLMPDGRPEITTCHSRTAMTVDYILYTPELITPSSLPGGRRRGGLHLLCRLSLVGQSELEDVGGLPSRCHSSDHLPLLARFRFWH